MSEKYSYLKKKGTGNYFAPVTIQKILEAEKLVGFQFPTSLKEFWLEIGCGFFRVNIRGICCEYFNNEIMHPSMVANVILRKDLSDDYEEALNSTIILSDVLDDYLEKDDIPFFEIADSSDFLKMKKNSDSVFRASGRLVEPNFEIFIWRMYHKAADYYLPSE
jgi:hypothetical protein